MIYFATVSNGTVTGGGYSPDGTLPAGAIACTQAQAEAIGPWSSIVSGALVVGSPPAPPAPTLAQQAAAAMNAGLTITSSSTPALNGTYACDATAQSHFMAEMIALMNSSGATFADGTASIVWPNMSGSLHTCTPAQFQPLALAVGAYVSGLYKVINGTLATLPAASATIA